MGEATIFIKVEGNRLPWQLLDMEKAIVKAGGTCTINPTGIDPEHPFESKKAALREARKAKIEAERTHRRGRLAAAKAKAAAEAAAKAAAETGETTDADQPEDTGSKETTEESKGPESEPVKETEGKGNTKGSKEGDENKPGNDDPKE